CRSCAMGSRRYRPHTRSSCAPSTLSHHTQAIVDIVHPALFRGVRASVGTPLRVGCYAVTQHDVAPCVVAEEPGHAPIAMRGRGARPPRTETRAALMTRSSWPAAGGTLQRRLLPGPFAVVYSVARSCR